MIRFKRKITIPFLLLFLLFAQTSYSQDQDVLEILEIIQKDLKTLEKAVYSDAGSEDLNIKTEAFPSNIVAGMFNFTKKEYFEIEEKEKENIKVKF